MGQAWYRQLISFMLSLLLTTKTGLTETNSPRECLDKSRPSLRFSCYTIMLKHAKQEQLLSLSLSIVCIKIDYSDNLCFFSVRFQQSLCDIFFIAWKHNYMYILYICKFICYSLRCCSLMLFIFKIVSGSR